MKKRQLIRLSLAVLLLQLGISAGDATAQQKSASEKSYMQARQVLNAGIEALGGLEAMEKLDDLSMKYKGVIYARNQSLKPETPYSTQSAEGMMTVDFKRRWIVFENDSTLPGFRFHSRQLLKGEKGFVVDLEAKAISPVTSPNFFTNVTRPRFPHVLLRTALERSATLRSLGAEDYEGKKQNVITFATAEGAQLTLYFDAGTNLLTKYENLDTDAMAGDITVEFIFPEYRSVGNLKMPASRIIKRAGETLQDVKYLDVQLNTHPAESVFDKPAGFEERPEAPASPQLTVTELAKDVHLLQNVSNGYNVMVVVFNDHVLVAEAPLNAGTSQRAIAKIKEIAPNKPIKYLVLTHHHDDHAGGTRSYLGEGATLVTTAGNKNYFEQMAKASRTIEPDALTKNGRKPVIEFFENSKRVFSDDKHVVEVHNIGPGPHANEMLVVYLPKEKILFQGDLLNLPALGGIDPANETTTHFADWIKKMGFEVDKIAAVHGRTATMDELRQSVERTRAAK